jgi:predicted DsbA family dithiol-disulfide isomerase
MFEGLGAQFSTQLVDWAVKVGARRAEVEKALREGRFDKTIDRDLAIAKALDISGTPASLVRGYYLSGAQPDSVFDKLFRRALADARNGKQPAKLAQSDIDAARAELAGAAATP